MRPKFQKAVDSVEDLVKSGMPCFEVPGADMWKQLFMTHPNEYMQQMGNDYIICDDYDQYYDYQVLMTEKGGWCQLGAYMEAWQWKMSREKHPQGRGYWKSKDILTERRYLNIFANLFVQQNKSNTLVYCKQSQKMRLLE